MCEKATLTTMYADEAHSTRRYSSNPVETAYRMTVVLQKWEWVYPENAPAGIGPARTPLYPRVYTLHLWSGWVGAYSYDQVLYNKSVLLPSEWSGAQAIRHAIRQFDLLVQGLDPEEG